MSQASTLHTASPTLIFSKIERLPWRAYNAQESGAGKGLGGALTIGLYLAL